MPPPINTPNLETCLSVTKQGTLCFMGHLEGVRNRFGIFISEIGDDGYTAPRALPEQINSKSMDWTPYIARNGSYLIFASRRPGKYGACDLYISFKDDFGLWSKPVNMGDKINTKQQERFPSVSPDGKYLFFTRSEGADKHDIYWVSANVIKTLRPKNSAYIRMIKDLPYADTDNPRQMLDLMFPAEKADTPLPVIVFIHGGGWGAGRKTGGWKKLSKYVASGRYAGATIGYRLSGESKWPSQIHDCKAAIRWIRANAQEYGLAPDKIAVWGVSAGGHLAAILGTSADIESMNGTLGPHTGVSSRVACVVDFCGPTDFMKMSPVLTASTNNGLALLIGGSVQDNPEKAMSANPIRYVTSDDPPFLIVHGTMDPSVKFNQSQLLHDALDQANVVNTFITVDGGKHKLIVSLGQEILDYVDRFLAHHLLDEPSHWNNLTIQAKPTGK